MSLPSENRDQLLSGYLDDALSAEEHAQAERLLRSDESFAQELEELKSLRESLKSVFREDSRVRLGEGFSSRVLDAAVAQASSEGLPDDHPLMLLAGQPTSSHSRHPASRPRVARLQVVGALLAIAASLGLAIFFFAGGEPDQPIAQQPGPAAIENLNGDDLNDRSPATGEIRVAQDPSQPGDATLGDPLSETPSLDQQPSASAERVANANIDAANIDAASIDAASNESQIGDTTNEVGNATANPAAIENIATSDVVPDADAAMELTEDMLRVAPPILVYSVTLTDAGRETDAFKDAMRRAGIVPGAEQSVAEEVKQLVKNDEQIQATDQQPTIVYLQASAKSLDQLYLNLLSDEQGVESIGLAISMNAPVSRLAQELKVNPTTVRHQGRVLELSQEVSQVQQAAAAIEALPFTFGRERKEATSVPSNGPDQMGEVLIIVR